MKYDIEFSIEAKRVVYRIYDETVTVLILTSRGHYDDK
jgi:hypothetical protein